MQQHSRPTEFRESGDPDASAPHFPSAKLSRPLRWRFSAWPPQRVFLADLPGSPRRPEHGARTVGAPLSRGDDPILGLGRRSDDTRTATMGERVPQDRCGRPGKPVFAARRTAHGNDGASYRQAADDALRLAGLSPLPSIILSTSMAGERVDAEAARHNQGGDDERHRVAGQAARPARTAKPATIHVYLAAASGSGRPRNRLGTPFLRCTGRQRVLASRHNPSTVPECDKP